MSSEQTLVDVPMAAHPPSSAAADPTHSISDGSLSDAFVPSTGSLAPSGREHSGLSWRYEMRRQCQEILPEALYLGPADSGRYLPPLHALGITAIVIVRTDVEAPFLKPRFPNQFQYAVFDVGDRFEQNLIRIVPELVSFIDGATRDRGKVLVHDDNGISRAPALVIMYLMEKFSVSYDVAAAHVQERRYCVHLNEGFVVQCKAYEAMIQARIQHAQQQQQQQQRQLNGASINGTGNGLRKRGMDDDEGDEGDAGSDRTRRAPAQQMRLG